MAERFNTYYGSVHCRATGREICPNGENVRASDYDALKSERDAYEARIAELEAKVKKYADNIELKRESLCERENTIQFNREDIKGLRAELARVKAESLRVVVGEPLRLGDIESVPISEHTNTFIAAGADWRIYAAERRVDKNGHRYMMPVSDEWPPIAFGPDTIVQPVRLEHWEDVG